MEDQSNMKNPARSYTHRRGQAKPSDMVLGIGAIVGLGVAGIAMWSLLNPPTATRLEQLGAEEHEAIVASSGGIAATESIEEILGAVQVYVQSKQYPQATTVLEHAVSQYPGDQELHLALGDLYMLQNRHANAYAQYVSGIEIGPSSAVAEFTAGTLANMLDQHELAAGHYNAAMKLDPKNPDTPIFLAAIQMKMNRLGEAKKNLAQASVLAPERARIYGMRSEIAMRENKLGIALEQVRRAIDLEPREVGWILQEARVLKRSGKAEQALNQLASLAQENIDLPETAMIMAECYGMLGRPGDAASRLMDVAQKHPDDAKLAFEVALWLDRAGERDDAVRWARRAVEAGNERAEAWIESLE